MDVIKLVAHFERVFSKLVRLGNMDFGYECRVWKVKKRGLKRRRSLYSAKGINEVFTQAWFRLDAYCNASALN
jgi:hypothetical protein